MTIRNIPMQLLKFLLIASLLLRPIYAETLTATQGMVSSRSELASEVGNTILQEGGNAIDAAVATAFALSVTYPSAGNLGGGGFMVIALQDGTVLTQDHREVAPAAAHRDMFLDANGNANRKLSVSSLLSSGVPGSVAGLLDALQRYGTMSRQQVIAPAITLAEEGFILNEEIAGQFAQRYEAFSNYPASLAKFTNNGEPYQSGDRWVQPDLARTLQRISELGHDGFYKGETADLLVSEMQKNGGMISHEDLAAYLPVWREPVHGEFRGYDIWSMPPPSSGGILLVEMFNMLEDFDLQQSGWGSAETIHLMLEAQRRGYADRAEFLGDPAFTDIPMAMLTSDDYAKQRFSDFDPQQASDSNKTGAGSWPQESRQTTHFSVVDKQGNAVSLTTTLNRSYGNQRVVPGAGFLLNNEMDDFASKVSGDSRADLVNAVAAGKRMLSSMSPTIVTKDGKVYLVTGSPGGAAIINTVFQVLMNVLEHKMSLEAAVHSPRFTHQWQPDIIRFETGAIPDTAKKLLEDMGHKGFLGSGFHIGEANSIMVEESGLTGVSDPRIIGGVAGY